MTDAAILEPRVAPLYPFGHHYLRLRSGHRMHFLDEGTGDPLLMLHGNPTWSFYYRSLVLGLRNGYRCIVPDHLGCGLSDKPSDWSYRIRDHADNLGELVRALDLRKITLVAHDWGGPIGFLAAASFPERVARFVTFNTGVALLSLPWALRVLRAPLLGPVIIQGLNGLLRAGLIASAMNGHRLAENVRAGYLAPYDSWSHRVAILRFVREIPFEAGHVNRTLPAQLDQALAQFRDRPHLVMWGLRDPVFGPDYLEAWRQRFPGAEVHVFKDAAHWVVEEAHERIVPLMRSFLSRAG